MSAFSVFIGAVVLVLVLLRQVAVRPVPRVLRVTVPVFIGVIGLFELIGYANGHHHIAGSAWAWVFGTLLIGAVGLGIVRGLTVRIWTAGNWVLRQGTAVTMVLWLVSLAVHFAGDAFGAHAHDGSGLVASSFLLYLGLTLGVQAAVVHRRAEPLWAQLGPPAANPFQMNFSQGPGAFFATFRTGQGGPAAPAGWGDAGPFGGPADYDDPNVIDAEVVEDTDDPPELPRAR
jgi:uncharacterized membrane protein YvlD (DUF360 family)